VGIAASLFFDRNAETDTLHRRVTPSDDQQADQQERWNDLVEVLKTKLKSTTGYPVFSWLQGSYKFGTQIRPVRKDDEFDIDLGLYFQWDGKPSDGHFHPKALKYLTQTELKAYAAEFSEEVRSVGEPKKRCCRIHYKGQFHIDIPVYHEDPKSKTVALATQDDTWEDSDPEALVKWFQGLFDDAQRAVVRRLIRYIKAWSALTFENEAKRPSSMVLTVLIAEAAKQMPDLQSGADDTLLRNAVDRVRSRLSATGFIANPVNGRENIMRLSPSDQGELRSQLEKLLGIADRALAAPTQLVSADIWQEAVLHFFPLPVDAGASATANNLPAVIATPEVSISATSRDNTNLRFSGTNSITVPRNTDLLFTVTNPHALPLGCVIEWTVRNAGPEAENINDLGHRAGTGLTAKEHTAYQGTHFMDCAVRSSGRLIALRRVKVTVTGIAAPRRNALRRPSWTQFRK
jgi:hypothetical protein